MVDVIGVRFKQAGKIYYFDPEKLEIEAGDHVIVETARGMEYGEVVSAPKSVPETDIVAPLKPVVRMATEEDRQKHTENVEKKKDALRVCKEKIDKHHLEMKLIDVEYTFDNSKIIFYFTADGRVDFRELVKDLAAVFRMRIELRQIGVRDEAKMLGGLGTCGKALCCHSWLPDFEPVSIKMAKLQDLSLNPTKISGICGRLMCCLKYENEAYSEAKKMMPDVGDKVKTAFGEGEVVETNLLREMIKVRMLAEAQSSSKQPVNDIVSLKQGEFKRVGGKKKGKEKDILDELDQETLKEIKELLDD